MKDILYVEGENDKHIFWNLFKRKGDIPETFEVKVSGNDAQLLKDFGSCHKLDVRSFGIVIDADQDLEKRWHKIRKILLEIQCKDVPENMDKNGLIVQHMIGKKHLKIGIWIMPDNNTKGMIEDFIHFLVPDNDNLMPLVDEVLQNIEKKALNKYNLIHKSKARIHTWLAWQEEPGTPMGLAITKKYLDPNHESCDLFINWINELFTETTPSLTH